MNDNTIILQPRYVADFQCDGNICNAKCCKGWRIDIDLSTYQKYQRIKNPVMRRKIISSMEPNEIRSGYMQIKLDNTNGCPLICKDNLCYIQRNLGADALSLTCQVYPRVVRYIGDCQLRILSITCPVAAEKALFRPHGMDIDVISSKADALWKLALQTDKMDKNAETQLAANVILGGLSILQNAHYTREEKMVILGLFLDKADELKLLSDGAEEISKLALFYNSAEFKIQIAELFGNWKFYSTAHGQFLSGILSVLQEKKCFIDVSVIKEASWRYDENYLEFNSIIDQQYENVIDNYWQQEFLCHGFPFCLKGSFMHNYFAYLISYKIWEMYLYGYLEAFGGELKNEKLLDLVTRYSKKLNHITKYLEYLVEHITSFESEPIKLMQVLLRIK